MTMMIWLQNTDPPATCSIQGSLTLGLEEAVEENHHPTCSNTDYIFKSEQPQVK